MKKVFVLLAAVSVMTWSMSCGGKKEEPKAAEEEDSYVAEPKKASPEEMIKEGQALVDGADCKTCHHPTNKIVGPSHTDVAKKYEFTQANVTLLAGKIITGGSGVWGEIPMSPHAGLSQSDAEKMAMYVLSLDGEKPAQ